ncbi:hypothetical protein ACLOJK_030355 [Asimina triloba]
MADVQEQRLDVDIALFIVRPPNEWSGFLNYVRISNLKRVTIPGLGFFTAAKIQNASRFTFVWPLPPSPLLICDKSATSDGWLAAGRMRKKPTSKLYANPLLCCLFSPLPDAKEPNISADATAANQSLPAKLGHWQWWLLVIVNIFFLLSGQSIATLLGRFYYDEGGNSKWMATLVQSAAFPILFVPLFLFPSSNPFTNSTATSARTLVFIYVALGLLIAGDNMMYSYGLLYLPVSTYSLICATQLAFNAVFSYFINSQKFTSLVLNSVVLLTFSAALLGVTSDSEGSTSTSTGKHVAGFLCTLGASATYSLILSLMQLSFEKILKKETFSVVLEMQIYTSAVATCVCVVGLFASGDWRTLSEEMDGYGKGKVSYIMTLIWTAVGWQICSVGVVGLIFVVSSLFSNVISTLALPVVPIFAVIFFHDTMNGVKIISILLAVWGFMSYIYQHYLDDSKSKAVAAAAKATAKTTDVNGIYSVGVVGLIFVASSLFSNVICTLALPVVPVFAVIFFHDKMNGVKIISILLAIWGFISCIYQLYLDDSKSKVVAAAATATARTTDIGIKQALCLCERILEGLSVVLEMRIYPGAGASGACIAGLFFSAKWKNLRGELESFGN